MRKDKSSFFPNVLLNNPKMNILLLEVGKRKKEIDFFNVRGFVYNGKHRI